MTELELTCGQCSSKFKIEDVGRDKVFCTSCGSEVPVPRSEQRTEPATSEEPAVAPVVAAEQRPETVAEAQEQPVAPESDRCQTCGSFVTSEKQYHCMICDGGFCDNCPGIHIPPRSAELEAKVIYKYKPRTSTVWIGDTHTFLDKLPNPLCPNCYDKEYVRVMWRMKWNIKNWKVDMLRDESIKIIEETPPGEKKILTEEVKAKEREVKSARELLAHLSKVK
jgi:DNA-directed RNA polymerase subunit RPC12/RpoP